MYLARILRGQGGIPAYGNLSDEWEAGCQSDFDSPEYKR